MNKLKAKLILPFTLLPYPILSAFSKYFLGAGDSLMRSTPKLKLHLEQAKIDISTREYAALVAASIFFNQLFSFLMIFLVGAVIKVSLIVPAILLSLIVAAFSFVYNINYPKITAMARVKYLDAQLIPALRQILIEIRSGVPLYNAMISVTSSHGEVSEEFAKITKEIGSGKPEADAFSAASERNYSFKFRRVLWQISNALKAGADVGDALAIMVDELSKDKLTEIKRYGQELNPWSMVYMLGAVAIPSMGVSFLIVLLSLTGALIPKIILPIILGILILFQMMFHSFIKGRRPILEGVA